MVLSPIKSLVKNTHRVLMLGEEGDTISWTIMTMLFVFYLSFSLVLVTVYGSTVILEFTRFAHDNMAHLYIPRVIVDNGVNSRLANLGTVWLPLYHILLIPLAIIDVLYYSGLAGAFVNALFIATTASALYIILRSYFGVAASLVYGLSAYSLIHASSTYMVPLGQFLAFGCYVWAEVCRDLLIEGSD